MVIGVRNQSEATGMASTLLQLATTLLGQELDLVKVQVPVIGAATSSFFSGEGKFLFLQSS